MAALTDREIAQANQDECSVVTLCVCGAQYGPEEKVWVTGAQLHALRRYMQAITHVLALDDESTIDLALRLKRKHS